MLNAVWSFWSKPYLLERRTIWHREYHHWLAWALSVHTAAQHYPHTVLVTDDAGARILIDELQLPFCTVSTALHRLRDADPEWWALGKIETYRRQRDPFVHIDTDVFLWKPLGDAIQTADVFAQNPEPIMLGNSCYRPEALEHAIGHPKRGWLPPEWLWYRTVPAQRAECCGIFGGNRLDFIHDYATAALRMIASPRNQGLNTLEEKIGHMILIEQYLLTAFLEYRGVNIKYLFDSIEDAYRPDRAAEAGYTHLAAGAKQNSRVCRHLEMRVQQDLPEFFERCIALAVDTSSVVA